MWQDVDEKDVIDIFRKNLFSLQGTIFDIICVQNQYSLITQDVTVPLLTCFSILSSEDTGKRVQNNSP